MPFFPACSIGLDCYPFTLAVLIASARGITACQWSACITPAHVHIVQIFSFDNLCMDSSSTGCVCTMGCSLKAVLVVQHHDSASTLTPQYSSWMLFCTPASGLLWQTRDFTCRHRRSLAYLYIWFPLSGRGGTPCCAARAACSTFL